jgi:RP/EB family microtubule-associated protein
MELLNWLNATLDLHYTKVEQLGSGAAYCQIIDSIFLDLPMTKVKFDATKEYEYLNNFKVLQSAFLRHKVNKTIPVERLIKCRFQDNLEFFQWIRKFWKENKDEAEYNPNARRKYAPPPTPGAQKVRTATRPPASSTNGTTRRSVSNSSTSSTPLPRTASQAASKPSSRVTSGINTVNREIEVELQETKASVLQMEEELGEYKNALDALESERNFYFNKLREIEILTETTNGILKDESTENPTLKDVLIRIQEVLYSTEEGFLIPEENEVPDVNMEEETF